jgi:hypothetical protein
MLLASAPWLNAQALGTTSVSLLQNILICSRPDVLATNFEPLPRPLMRPPGLNISPDCLPSWHTEFLKWAPLSIEQVPVRTGLNISPDCLPSWHTEFLKWDPLSIEQVPVRSGSPMICGIAYYRGVPTRVCTRG